MITEKELGVELKPKTAAQLDHKKLTQSIYRRIRDNTDKKLITGLITRSGVLRGSLG